MPAEKLLNNSFRLIRGRIITTTNSSKSERPWITGKGIYYHELYLQANDSLLNEERSNAIAQLQILYETGKNFKMIYLSFDLHKYLTCIIVPKSFYGMCYKNVILTSNICLFV